MSKDLIGKYCLVYMTPSKTEFRPEISAITDLHNLCPNTHVFLDNDYDSIYHIRGLLVSDNKETLEEVLKVQELYLSKLHDLRTRINNLNKEHSIDMSKMIRGLNSES